MKTATPKTPQALFSDPSFQAGYKAAQSLTDVLENLEPLEEPEATEEDQIAEQALRDFYEANEESKKLASRIRKLRKVIDALPEADFGHYRVRWAPNADREEVDMETVTTVFAALGRKVPMQTKQIKPSLNVEKL